MRHIIIRVNPLIDLPYVFNKFYDIIRDEYHSFWEEAIFTEHWTVVLKNYKITLHFIPGDTPRDLIELRLAPFKPIREYELENCASIRQLANDIVKDCRYTSSNSLSEPELRYLKSDIINTMEVYDIMLGCKHPTITKVISSGPATIAFWDDGTKTVVKCQEGDTYDIEKGILYAVLCKCISNNKDYHNFLMEMDKFKTLVEERRSK